MMSGYMGGWCLGNRERSDDRLEYGLLYEMVGMDVRF